MPIGIFESLPSYERAVEESLRDPAYFRISDAELETRRRSQEATTRTAREHFIHPSNPWIVEDAGTYARQEEPEQCVSIEPSQQTITFEEAAIVSQEAWGSIRNTLSRPRPIRVGRAQQHNSEQECNIHMKSKPLSGINILAIKEKQIKSVGEV